MVRTTDLTAALVAKVVVAPTAEVAMAPMGELGPLNSQGALLHHQAIPLHQPLRHHRRQAAVQ